MQPLVGGAPSLDEAGILRAWEAAASRIRPWRELALLEAVSGTPLDELARLPIGERDRRLLAIRRAVFGDQFEFETTCPACGERLELEVDASTIDRPRPDRVEEDLVLASGDWSVAFRLPDSTDIAVAGDAPTAADAEFAILDRCVLSVGGPGGAVGTTRLPEEVRDQLVARLESLDPGADLSVDMTCPACGNDWQAPLDPASVVIAEVEAKALRLMGEVDLLARVYGWREPDVLALSPMRRWQYLEMAGR
jgi:hypothetical protein